MLPRATHLSDWRPRETLYSLCARHHHVAGNATPATTSRQLFGHSRAAAHDLPLFLEEFIHRVGTEFGGADTIALDHTILRFHLQLRSPIERANVLAAVRTGGCGGLKARLGLLASRFGASHPLKVCLSCRKTFFSASDIGYWHLDDQWPGAWTCARCGALLHWTTERVHGGNRFGWLLPSDCEFRPGTLASLSEGPLHTIRQFAENVRAFAHGEFLDHVTNHDLQRAFRDRAIDLGLVAASGRVDAASFSHEIVRTTGALSRIDELSALPTTAEEAGTQFLRLVRGTARPAHVIRILVLVQVLFGTWDEFRSAIQIRNVGPTDPGIGDQSDSDCLAQEDPRRRQFAERIRSGYSVSKAAADIGIATATGIAWAAQLNVDVSLRPSKLRRRQRAMAEEMLRGGADKDSVARRIGVSVSSINLILKVDPELSRQRLDAIFLRRQRIYRDAWSGTALKLTSPGPKALRQLQPAAFMWLYRNDRAWLEAFNSQLNSAPRTPSMRIDWDKRDRQLAHAVAVARSKLAEDRPECVIRQAHVCDLVPTLKARLSQLDRLPLTRMALGRKRRQTSIIG
ncbi:MAG: TnsD family Tn7-like transposition protein [Panacagrimonas sp.]